jgi:hypothetical protein
VVPGQFDWIIGPREGHVVYMKTLVLASTSRTQADDAHSRHSSLRASIIDHLFVGELLRFLWRQGMRSVELLRAEVDAGGYDLVIECNGVTRYIQLKSSHKNAKTHRVDVNTGLAGKPGGCVVWIQFDHDMNLGPYLWLGSEPGDPVKLGEQVARHSRGPAGAKRLRPNIRVVRKISFTELRAINDLVTRLFGSILSAGCKAVRSLPPTPC